MGLTMRSVERAIESVALTFTTKMQPVLVFADQICEA
jgi:hypothetical protein